MVLQPQALVNFAKIITVTLTLTDLSNLSQSFVVSYMCKKCMVNV